MDRARKNFFLRLLWFIAGVTAMMFIWSRPSAAPYFPAESLSGEQSAAAQPAEGDGSVDLGDLNKDGSLDAADLLELQNIYITGTSALSPEEQLQIADINSDGLIDTTDTALLTAYMTDTSIDTNSISLRDYVSRYAG